MIARVSDRPTLLDRLRAWETDLAVSAASMEAEGRTRPLNHHGRRQLRRFRLARQIVRAARFLVRQAVGLVGEP